MTKSEIEETAQWTVDALSSAYADINVSVSPADKKILYNFVKGCLTDWNNGAMITKDSMIDRVNALKAGQPLSDVVCDVAMIFAEKFPAFVASQTASYIESDHSRTIH